MFDDLDPAFDPNAPAALEKVAVRVHQLRVRRRMAIGGVAGAIVAVTMLTSAAFALNNDSNGSVRVVAPGPTTPTTFDSATSTTAVTKMPSTTAVSAPTTIAGPTSIPGSAGTVPARPGDPNPVVAVEPNTLTMTEGDEVTITVTFKNDGGGTVSVYEGPCEYVEVPDPRPCATPGRSTEKELGPGVVLAYPVVVRSLHDWGLGNAGSFTIPIAFNGVSTSVPVTVREGVSASISPTKVTVKAGTDAVTTLQLRNGSNTEQGLGYAPSQCPLSLVPLKMVCAQQTQIAGVQARSEASKRIAVVTTGAQPGTYTVKIDQLNFTVVVVA